jgi:hypothetical protein
MVKLNALKASKSVAFVFLVTFFLVPIAYSQTEKIKLSDFLPLAYTSNFKKSVQTNFEGVGKVDGEKISANFLAKQDVGVFSNFKNTQWIKVNISANGIFNDASFIFTLVHFYDLKSKLKMYEISVDDETVKKFEWKTIPVFLTLGQAVEVGSYKETNNKDKLISTAKISYLITKIKNGYEFCEIENIQNLETGESEVIEECDLFSVNKKLTGARSKVKIGDNTDLMIVGKSTLK